MGKKNEETVNFTIIDALVIGAIVYLGYKAFSKPTTIIKVYDLRS